MEAGSLFLISESYISGLGEVFGLDDALSIACAGIKQSKRCRKRCAIIRGKVGSVRKIRELNVAFDRGINC